MGVADRFRLEVANRQSLGADITKAIQSIERTGSMELQRKPTVVVTVNDPLDVLMESNVLVRPARRPTGAADAYALRPIDVMLDGVWYRLDLAERSGDLVRMTFTHRGAYYMSRHDTPMSASRADVTRALFIRRQVLEVAKGRGAGHRLGFWASELRREMPIARGEAVSDRAESDRDAGSRSRAGAPRQLRVRGKVLNASQRRNAAIALERAERKGAKKKATIALFEALIIEPADPAQGVEGVPFGNPLGGHSSSVGPLQLLDIHLNGSASTNGGRRDYALVCDLFLTKGFTGKGGAIEIARKNPGWTAGQVAQEVQGSAFPDRYDTVRRDAEAVYNGLGGVDSSSAEPETYAKPYRFRRPRGEDAWTNTGTLAEEVGRRRFVTFPAPGLDLFIYSDDAGLLALRPQATIDMRASYIVGRPEYDLSYGRTVRSMTLQIAGNEFAPDLAWGLPVLVEGSLSVGGRWLVWEVREVDGRTAFDVEFRQPQKGKLEPATERVQRADTSDSAAEDEDSPVARAYKRAKVISERGYPYVWGGGHRRAGRPDAGTAGGAQFIPGVGGALPVGYDCSGYTAACLHAGDMLPDGWANGVPASGTFETSWGEAGEGDELTVWANDTHVFIEFKIAGKRGKFADTSRQAAPPSKEGPTLRTGDRPTAGFTPRRWPGA